MKYKTTLYLFGHEYRATIEADTKQHATQLIRESLNRQARITAEPIPDVQDSTLEQLKNLFGMTRTH